MQELQEKINGIIADYFGDGAFDEALEKAVTGCLEKVIQEQFKSYGGIAKKVEEELEKAINLDFSQMELPSYNQFIFDMIKTKFVGVLEAQAGETFVKDLEQWLTPAPKSITVQELVNIYKEGKFEAHEVMGEQITVEVREWEYSKGWHNIKIWDTDGKSSTGSSYSSTTRKHTPDVHLFVDGNKKIRIMHHPHGRENLGTTGRDWEGKLWLMCCSGTIITDINEVDEDDICVDFDMDD